LGRILQRLERHIDACGALHQALAASHDADDETTHEARARFAFSLLELRLRETAHVVLSHGPVDDALRALVGRLDDFAASVQEIYGARGTGFSERYRVLASHGGPFPEAYVALDTMGEQRVLIQPLCGKASARDDYVVAQRKLSEPPMPGVLPLVDADDRRRYVVFAAPRGTPLASAWVTSPPTAPQVQSIALQLLDALQKAHGRGVLHGVVNPWAIYVRPGWNIVVAGFELG